MQSISELAGKAEIFAREFSKKHIAKSYLFHSLAHFEQTVKSAVELGQEHNLSEEDLEDIAITMWFHDLGFKDGWQNHEERSAEIATDFLRKELQADEKINRISHYIITTNRLEEPRDIIEKIVLDADTAHVGRKNYFDTLGRLRAEWETKGDKRFTEREWIKLNLNFLNEHKFYTAIARNKYSDRKRKHQIKLQKQLENLVDFESIIQPETDENGLSFLPKKSDRGVETMFRVTLRNHNNLSRIADNKANIMLSINAIMLSIIISSLVPKLLDNPLLLVPTIILILVCMASIILATLSTRPKITSAKYSDEKFLDKRFNILFFGNFYQMPLEKFEWGIKNLMQNEELLYSSLSKDLYYLGLVLAKKYRYLNICYNVFMIGLLIAAASFIFALTLRSDQF